MVPPAGLVIRETDRFFMGLPPSPGHSPEAAAQPFGDAILF
jgi:hypothetical protein